ncbi:MAG: branched-chain amino acid transporter permease [Blastococcus sp.]|nr:branched-chain amino acid transporter permease [Blastococcus sp.]
MSLPPRLRALLVPLAVVLVLVAGGFVPGAEQRLVTEMLVFGLFAMSLNVLLGYTGLPSLGHGLYFGLSAYATAILVRDHTENLLVILLLAPLVAAVVAALVGLIALRTSGAYFLMITFALAQLGVAFTTQASDLTGGADGLAGIFRPDLGEGVDLYDAQQFYFLVAGVVLVGVAVLAQLLRSPFGRTLTGIRENPERMQALGFNVWAHRYAAFVLSGVFAGVAGVLVAYLNGFVSPDLLGLTTSAEVLLMVVLGGAGTLLGPMVGAIVVLGLEEVSKSVGDGDHYRMLLGAAYIVTVLVARKGVVRALRSLVPGRRTTPPTRPSPVAAEPEKVA